MLIDVSVSRLLRVRRYNIWKTPVQTGNGEMCRFRVFFTGLHTSGPTWGREDFRQRSLTRLLLEWRERVAGLYSQFIQSNSPATYCLTEAMLFRFLSIGCGYINCVIPFKKRSKNMSSALCMSQAVYEVRTTLFFVVVLTNLFYSGILDLLLPRRGIKFKAVGSIVECITITHYCVWRSHLCRRWHAHMRFVFVTRRKDASTSF